MIAQHGKARSKCAHGGTSRATAMTTACALQATSWKIRSHRQESVHAHLCEEMPQSSKEEHLIHWVGAWWRPTTKEISRQMPSAPIWVQISTKLGHYLPPRRHSTLVASNKRNQPSASATTTSISIRHNTSIGRNQPSASAKTTSIRTRHS